MFLKAEIRAQKRDRWRKEEANTVQSPAGTEVLKLH